MRLDISMALKYAIHSEPRLKGIKIGSKSYKMSQLAEDTVLFLRTSLRTKI